MPVISTLRWQRKPLLVRLRESKLRHSFKLFFQDHVLTCLGLMNDTNRFYPVWMLIDKKGAHPGWAQFRHPADPNYLSFASLYISNWIVEVTHQFLLLFPASKEVSVTWYTYSPLLKSEPACPHRHLMFWVDLNIEVSRQAGLNIVRTERPQDSSQLPPWWGCHF